MITELKVFESGGDCILEVGLDPYLTSLLPLEKFLYQLYRNQVDGRECERMVHKSSE